MSRNVRDSCPKCAHYDTCERPCIWVERDLGKTTAKQFFQRPMRWAGKDIIAVYPPPEERHNSALKKPSLDDFHEKGHVHDFETDEADYREFWATLYVQKKITGIFIDRLFNKWTFKDLAVKYDCSPSTAQAYFTHATNRLFEVLEKLDRLEKARTAHMKKVSGRLSPKIQAFLMAKCFDLSPKEISEILDKNDRTVARWIRECAAQIRAGKQIISFEGEETIPHIMTKEDERLLLASNG